MLEVLIIAFLIMWAIIAYRSMHKKRVGGCGRCSTCMVCMYEKSCENISLGGYSKQ